VLIIIKIETKINYLRITIANIKIRYIFASESKNLKHLKLEI